MRRIFVIPCIVCLQGLSPLCLFNEPFDKLLPDLGRQTMSGSFIGAMSSIMSTEVADNCEPTATSCAFERMSMRDRGDTLDAYSALLTVDIERVSLRCE